MPYYGRIALYFDGASRHNPKGPAGCGWVLYSMDHNGKDEFQIDYGSRYLGLNKSNNQAEYQGLIDALEFMYDSDIECAKLYIRGDAEVVLCQMDGVYQVRSKNIMEYYHKAADLLKSVDCGSYCYSHISRDKNWEADRLANEAIDE
uniref:RNase H type-1 domain-containing protein n=1 Tax=Entomoneis paludosa TaxID=265537 RepID=A0A7S2V8H0_9STRA|mmetsp:Transcript_11401/g.23371  ORF Transcript_11401/g.23371 Transcript_11401/m.23371 type:complete len:147 (+) Transcript_11401:290-730(+)|eukprot:CAMPEP_0172449648 /NCGR_PEP_ID=MMETSP1065-20121228/8302_1 /TAXON_ID=265537 /ORGANISM="Amphiprora paludosa, Strain CCMP125" /LENGTH=146 /DNA_ID=CAMNT_0013201361 /DNA_START=280 /DNA_END=720 /DNA_ORIENTATION=+